jgi:hypothetical protein
VRVARSVFLNCPFDRSYDGIFSAMIFCILDTGFIPRCALERVDSTEVRLDKICEIIGQCDYGIHDISYVQLDPQTALPRFNMPFELGLFLGCKRFGGDEQSAKRSLILDSQPYRYQTYISDVAGQDIQSHEGKPEVAVRRVRDWLRAASGGNLPSGAGIWERFLKFQAGLPIICEQFELSPDQLTYVDFAHCVKFWLEHFPGL